MLAETFFRIPRSEGLQVLQRRGERGARELTSLRLRLSAGASARWAASGEALLLPPDVELTVTAETQMEAVLVSTPAAAGGEPVLFGPKDVQVNMRGRGTYSREVHDICVRDPHGRRIMVGETLNPAGHWSSFPPHKHDGRDGEPYLEEVYHYRIDPPQGFGIQMIYTNDGESVTHEVRDGDAVLLPYGYHPVASPPGYRLYYLWALAGHERRLALFEDPAHRWIHEGTWL
jgi:5-deoxy-glucuronate isomerase